MGFLALILLIAVLVGGIVFIRRQTRAQGKWGLGSLSTACPRCGTRMPIIRKPASREEALWGGWTCSNCGCHIDKYGHERATEPGEQNPGKPSAGPD